MDLEKIIEAYCEKYADLTHSELANVILSAEKPRISHRQLRRRVSETRKRTKEKFYLTPKIPGTLSYKGRKSITSLKEAIDHFQIDLNQYEISGFTCNSWDTTNGKGKTFTNYQVKVKLQPRTHDIDFARIRAQLSKDLAPEKLKPSYWGNGTAVIGIADIHLGSKVSGLQTTQDYSFKDAIRRLRNIAHYANSRENEEVYLFIAGDMIETFTGMNHPTTWQELEENGYGANVLKIAHRIFVDFFKSIDNLKGFYMVAGNHDRISKKREEDPEGQAASILHYMLTLSFPDLNTEYDPFVVKKNVGGVRYVMAHDHNAMSKDIVKLLWQYGDQNKYNILFTGHWHQTKGKRVFHKMEEYGFDELNFRSVGLPPIFTGNRHSESLGYTSRAGFYYDEHIDEYVPDGFIKTLK